jgi:endonuclease YncB( thermonuclease family)
MRRRRRLLPLGAIAVVLGLVLAVVNEPWLDDLFAEKSFAGAARVVDGDSLEIASMRVRLYGVDAPELAQLCAAADGREYPCGREARERLVAAIAGRAVSCRREGRDRFRRVLARCHAGDDELGALMVRQGWAVAYAGADGNGHRALERAAQRARTGMWAGSFERPDAWRRQRRQE